MALLIHIEFNIIDLFYSYSIWLEAYAILPQIYMLNRNSQNVKKKKNLSLKKYLDRKFHTALHVRIGTL